jgi:hypothetical protein
VTVTTATGCNWTAATSDTWITVTGGAGRQRLGAVTYSCAVLRPPGHEKRPDHDRGTGVYGEAVEIDPSSRRSSRWWSSVSFQRSSQSLPSPPRPMGLCPSTKTGPTRTRRAVSLSSAPSPMARAAAINGSAAMRTAPARTASTSQTSRAVQSLRDPH